MRTPPSIMILATIIAGCGEPIRHATPPSRSKSDMTVTFQLPNGIQVADLSGISEAYSVTVAPDGYHVFTVNVSAENIHDVFFQLADDPAKYETALTELGIVKVDRVKTVWDNFTSDSPGKRNALTDATPTIWDMIEQLKKQGLYLAERRED